MTRPRIGEEAVELTRDAVTLVGYTAMATWAWFLYGAGAFMPLLRAEQGTSRTVMGLHSLALSLGGLVAGSVTVVVVRRLQRRGTVVLGIAVVSLGALLFLVGTAPALTLSAALIVGTGGSFFLNATIPALAQHHESGGPAVMSEGNAVGATVGLLAPLAVGASVGLGWGWRPALLVTMPLLTVMALALRRIPAGTPAMDTGPPPRGGPARPLPPVFWIYLAMVMACVAIEFCCASWAADLLRQRTGMSPGAASAGLTAVVAGIAAGRFAIGRLARGRAPRVLLAYSLGLTLAGWAVVWTATVPAVALTGLALTGLGISGHYPLGASLIYAAVPGDRDTASGRMSVFIASAAGAAPFALGAVADVTSTHTAFLAVPVLLALATVALTAAVRLAGREPS